jgi:hypothetical protein
MQTLLDLEAIRVWIACPSLVGVLLARYLTPARPLATALAGFIQTCLSNSFKPRGDSWDSQITGWKVREL